MPSSASAITETNALFSPAAQEEEEVEEADKEEGEDKEGERHQNQTQPHSAQ